MIKELLLKNKLLSACVIFFTFLQGLFGAGLALIFAKFIDMATLEKGNEAFIRISIVFFVYIIIYTLVNYLRRYFRSGLFVQVDKNIKLDYMNKLLALEPINYLKRDTAHYLSRMTNDLPVIISEYVMEFFNLILYFFEAIFSILVTFYINWTIAMIFIGLSFLIIIFTSVFERRFSDIKSNMSKANALYLTELKSTLGGFDDIKYNFSEEKFIRHFNESIDNVNIYRRSWWNLEAIYSPGNAFLTLLLTFCSIILSTLFYINGYFSMGILTAAIYISTRIFNPISNFFEQITYLKSNVALVKTVFDEVKEENGQGKVFINDIHSIIFKDLSFKYDSSKEYIFQNFNLHIKGGEKYLLIGESGIGKSTLLKIIMGLQDFDGKFLINDTAYENIDKSSIYSNIAYVPQIPYIFNGTIRENIDLAGIYGDEDIEEIIKAVKLDRFISEKGLDAMISEDVFQVSGGEKQRICLARGLIKQPKLLLLDEVTASLDKDTSVEIERLISTFDITTIYICHKGSKDLFSSFDYIIDLNNRKPNIMEAKNYEKRMH